MKKISLGNRNKKVQLIQPTLFSDIYAEKNLLNFELKFLYIFINYIYTFK